MKSKKLNIFVNEDGIKRNDIVGDFWKKILLGTRYFCGACVQQKSQQYAHNFVHQHF